MSKGYYLIIGLEQIYAPNYGGGEEELYQDPIYKITVPFKLHRSLQEISIHRI